jgi:mono/diheme cytochrome c family protein
MVRKWVLVLILLGAAMAGCVRISPAESPAQTPDQPAAGDSAPQQEDAAVDSDAGSMPSNPAMGGRRMGSMHARHHARIPQEYAGLSNPLEISEDTLAAGQDLYQQHCASCHGDTGMGDGPAGANLDPLPAPLAHSGLMLADDYLYWRIAEGGTEPPFDSGMPAWKDSFSEQEIWQVAAYLRGLGAGWVNPRGGGRGPGPGMGNSARIHEAMLEEAIERGLINEADAAVFNTVHDALDQELSGQRGRGLGLGMEAVQGELLAELVDNGTLTAEQVQTFQRVHDLLEEAGLME